ncbi:ubiquitin-conjugating enzyme E2 32, partial [Olea europaea subsp. europaea]
MAEDKYNLKNPAVKRILQEVKEMHSNPSDDFMSLPLEENIFEWQFAIRGPQDSEFEGGIYHGRIQLPAEYPFKPPSFLLLTSIWMVLAVRTALVALIAFLPTNPNGALGSLDYPKEVRRSLAIKSREAGPKFGSSERQKLIDEQALVPQARLVKLNSTGHWIPTEGTRCNSKESSRLGSTQGLVMTHVASLESLQLEPMRGQERTRVASLEPYPETMSRRLHRGVHV